jgi:site-specific DNA-methyltransferase (adenine-specific)
MKNKNLLNKIHNIDCLKLLDNLEKDSVDLLLTDIPYEFVNKSSNGLRKLDKEEANTMTFNLKKFLEKSDKVVKGSGYIFCGKEQVSEIFAFFSEKGYTTRLMIWEKTNPSPMNCKYTWMSGIETFIYFKKKGATFNEHYKNSVVRFPNGSSKIHPTQKPLKLFKYLVEVSSNKGDVVLDPCVGSGTTVDACIELGRDFIVSDISKKYTDMIIEKQGVFYGV